MIAAVKARQSLAARPFAPRPDPCHAELGVVARYGHEQMLEPAALLSFACSVASNPIQHITHAFAGMHIQSGLPSGKMLQKNTLICVALHSTVVTPDI